MKAAIVERIGEAPVFGDFQDPVSGPDEVVVRVGAAALSPLARARASGRHYSATGPLPFVVGVDGVGRLEDGRRVYFLLPRAPFGAMAEHAVVANGQWLPVPDGLDDATAAVIANPGMSSWAALTDRAGLGRGETVLINGATGASGVLAVRIARHLGAARVIATGRNRAVLESLGADATIPLSDGAAFEAALKPQIKAGVDVVLDYLWGPSARAILGAVAAHAPGGQRTRFVQIGNNGGAEIALPAAILRSSAIELKGSGLGSVSPPRLLAAIGGVFEAAPKAGLRLDHRALPLTEVSATWGDEGLRPVYLP